MKIRGNTIGTTIKPENVLVKSKNLTEEEKAQARANIGVDEIIGEIQTQKADKATTVAGYGITDAYTKAEADAHGSFKLIETITLEEETKVVSVDFDKKYKAVRVRVTFPNKITSNGYWYSKVKMLAGGQPGNMCGTNLPTGTLYADHIRIASEVAPVAVFSSATGFGNECAEPMKLSFPTPAQIVFNEKDGFAGFEVNTYAINFPAGTVIHIMGG